MLLIKLLLQYNYIYICAFVFVSLVIYYLSKIFNFQKFFRNNSSLKIVRVILILSLLTSFFIHLFIFTLYVDHIYTFIKLPLNNNLVVFPKLITNVTLD